MARISPFLLCRTAADVGNALIASVKGRDPALAEELREMLKPKGTSEFRIVVARRKKGHPNQFNSDRYDAIRNIWLSSPNDRAAVEQASDSLKISEVTARKYVALARELDEIDRMERESEKS